MPLILPEFLVHHHLPTITKTIKLPLLLLLIACERLLYFSRFSSWQPTQHPTTNTRHVLLVVLLRLPVRPSQLRPSQRLPRVRYDVLRRLLDGDNLVWQQYDTQLLQRSSRLPIHSLAKLPRNILKSATDDAVCYGPQHNLQSGLVTIPWRRLTGPRRQGIWRDIHVFLLPVWGRSQGLQSPATVCDVRSRCLQLL